MSTLTVIFLIFAALSWLNNMGYRDAARREMEMQEPEGMLLATSFHIAQSLERLALKCRYWCYVWVALAVGCSFFICGS